MDIAKKKQEVLEDIARQPANVVFARIDIVNEIQLADLMKAEFIPYFRGTARSVSSGTTGNSTDTLHAVCVNLAKQRALLQGAAVGDVIHFNIHSATFDGTTGEITGYHNSNTAPYTQNCDLTFPTLEDASYSNKTSLPFTVLHDLNSDGGIVNLSSTSNANTSITNDDGEPVKFFTDFSKYFEMESSEKRESYKRACWNSWIAPYNLQGFFRNFGDMLVKEGKPEIARKIYQTAMDHPDFETWPYK